MSYLKLPAEGFIIANGSARSTGKTTNSAGMIDALWAGGFPVQGFDGDESEQLTKWAEAWRTEDRKDKKSWDVDVTPCATQRAASVIRANLAPGEFGVVDCGHYENHRDIGRAICSVVDALIINCAATFGDIERMRGLPMKGDRDGFLESTALVRGDGLPVPSMVLLTRVQSGTKKATATLRKMLTEDDGYVVLDTEVPATQRYARICEDSAPRAALGVPSSRAVHADILNEIAEKLPNLRQLQASVDKRQAEIAAAFDQED